MNATTEPDPVAPTPVVKRNAVRAARYAPYQTAPCMKTPYCALRHVLSALFRQCEVPARKVAFATHRQFAGTNKDGTNVYEYPGSAFLDQYTTDDATWDMRRAVYELVELKRRGVKAVRRVSAEFLEPSETSVFVALHSIHEMPPHSENWSAMQWKHHMFREPHEIPACRTLLILRLRNYMSHRIMDGTIDMRAEIRSLLQCEPPVPMGRKHILMFLCHCNAQRLTSVTGTWEFRVFGCRCWFCHNTCFQSTPSQILLRRIQLLIHTADVHLLSIMHIPVANLIEQRSHDFCMNLRSGPPKC